MHKVFKESVHLFKKKHLINQLWEFWIKPIVPLIHVMNYSEGEGQVYEIHRLYDLVISCLLSFTYKIFGYTLEIQNSFVFLNNSVIRGVMIENNKRFRSCLQFTLAWRWCNFCLKIQSDFTRKPGFLVNLSDFSLTMMWFLFKDTKWFPQKTWVSCELIRFWKYLAHIRLFNMITQGYCLQSNIFLNDKTFNLIENSRKGFEFLLKLRLINIQGVPRNMGIK